MVQMSGESVKVLAYDPNYTSKNGRQHSSNIKTEALPWKAKHVLKFDVGRYVTQDVTLCVTFPPKDMRKKKPQKRTFSLPPSPHKVIHIPECLPLPI